MYSRPGGSDSERSDEESVVSAASTCVSSLVLPGERHLEKVRAKKGQASKARLQSLDEELEPALEIDAETDTINGTTRRASDLRDVHTDKPFQSPSRTIPLYLQQVEGGYAELSLVLHDVSTAADVRVVAAEEAMRAKLGRLIPVELHANAQESLLTTIFDDHDLAVACDDWSIIKAQHVGSVRVDLPPWFRDAASSTKDDLSSARSVPALRGDANLLV